MLLKSHSAVVYGGGGAIGGAIARQFARDGAVVHLAGRTREKLELVAREIHDDGGIARVAVVDALDPAAVAEHARSVANESGAIDVAVNAVGLVHVQGKPLLELSFEEFLGPIEGYARAQFAIGKAVAGHFVEQRRGVLITLSTPGANRAYQGVVGFAMACAAIECFTRQLSGELGAVGARVVCLRPDFMPETLERGSHARIVFGGVAQRLGLSLDELLARTPAGDDALLKRPATLDEIARTAAFVASPGAGALTATTLNVSCGSVVG